MIRIANRLTDFLPGAQLAVFFLVSFMGTVFGCYYSCAYWPDRRLAGTLLCLFLGCAITAAGIFTLNGLSGLASKLFAGPSARRGLRDRLRADLSVARNLKMNEKYDLALRTINVVLSRDPAFPEALFLKAQIVWEGFGNRSAALSNLEKLMAAVPGETDPLNRWAMHLHREITNRTG